MHTQHLRKDRTYWVNKHLVSSFCMYHLLHSLIFPPFGVHVTALGPSFVKLFYVIGVTLGNYIGLKKSSKNHRYRTNNRLRKN